jgi:hypothetical protein
MKTTLLLITCIALSSCANVDTWLTKKTGLDSAGLLLLSFSAKGKAEQLKAEYDAAKALPAIETTSAK